MRPPADSPAAPLRHLLIDLDGTLLGIDMAVFSGPFVDLLEASFSRLVPPGLCRRALNEGFKAVGESRDGVPLDLVFAGRFGEVAGLPPARVGPLFDDFYRGPFAELRRLSRPLAGARPLLDLARSLGLGLVLATKPVFPIGAIAERIAWAGLAEGDFDLVTALGNMRACKPRAEYWREILHRIGAGPEECLMAGNDRRQDLSAADVGIPIFLVDEGFVVDDPRRTWTAGESGTLADLAARLASSGRRRG